MVIFSKNKKRKLAIALMAVSLVCESTNFAGTSTINPNIIAEPYNDIVGKGTNQPLVVASNEDVAGNPDNRGMLAKVYHKIAAFVSQSKKRVDSFFDVSNNESYTKHITRMAEDLEHVERDIIFPLQEAIKQDASSDELYYEIVRKTNAIVTELHINLQTLVNALRAQQANKNAKAVIDALKAVQAKVASRLVNLERNINELLELCKQYDPALATIVSQLKAEFHRVNNANVNPIAALAGIMHRVKR